jgi:hypothetical protein
MSQEIKPIAKLIKRGLYLIPETEIESIPNKSKIKTTFWVELKFWGIKKSPIDKKSNLKLRCL